MALSKQEIQKIIATALFLFIMIGSFVYLWLMPTLEKRTDLLLDLDVLNLEISEAEIRRIQYNKLSLELDDLEEQWAHLSILMPTGFESTVAMYFIQTGIEDFARDIRIDLTAPWSEFAGALVYPVKISYFTDPDLIEDTLRELEEQPFVFRLSSMAFVRSTITDDNKLGMNVTLDYLVNNPGMTLGDSMDGERFGTLSYRRSKMEEALDGY